LENKIDFVLESILTPRKKILTNTQDITYHIPFSPNFLTQLPFQRCPGRLPIFHMSARKKVPILAFQLAENNIVSAG
jgi:hypothetical protein